MSLVAKCKLRVGMTHLSDQRFTVNKDSQMFVLAQLRE